MIPAPLNRKLFNMIKCDKSKLMKATPVYLVYNFMT